MTPISHVKRVSQEAEQCKQEVCRLLGWTELEYCTLQYESGIQYLSHYLNNDQWGVDMIIRCRVFWNWWKNHWTLRDKEFLVYIQCPVVYNARKRLYILQNDPDELSKTITPNGTVLQDAYAYMMGVLIDETHTS